MYLSSISAIVPINPMSMVYDPFPPSSSSKSSTIQNAIRDALLTSRLTVYQMEDLPGHLHRISKIRLSDSSRLILKLSPTTATPVLQHERYCLESEAAIVSILAETTLPIPHILKYEKRSIHLGSPFLLTTYLPGITYSSALPYLTRSERLDIDQQLRSLNLQINAYKSRTFGPAAMTKGLQTWQEAFRLMMETILVDGENVGVNLPYIEIREAVSTLAKSLDEVREARLVIPGLGRPENVLIERRTNDVTGLLDFGQALWGDVEFDAMMQPDECVGVGVGVKGLLYTVYHAIVTIVTNHYRPQKDTAKELGARKTLTTALGRLALEREGAVVVKTED